MASEWAASAFMDGEADTCFLGGGIERLLRRMERVVGDARRIVHPSWLLGAQPAGCAFFAIQILLLRRGWLFFFGILVGERRLDLGAG